MSVSTNQPTDTSTDHANWGTLVIVLVLVIAAVVIGTVLYSGNTASQHPVTLINSSASAPQPAAR